MTTPNTTQEPSLKPFFLGAAILGAIAVSLVAYQQFGPKNLKSMSLTEQTHYVARCSALLLTTSSIAEAQGMMPQARQLYSASSELNNLAGRIVGITRATELTLDYAKDRRQDVVAGRMTFKSVGEQADECVKTVQKSGLL